LLIIIIVCACSVLLLRTSVVLNSPDLCRVAGDLESSLNERPSQLIVRQHVDDPSSVFVECCRREAVDRLREGRLSDAGFTEGPDPGRVTVLREGDVLELSFRGNIEVKTSEEQSSSWSRQFVYNSNLSSLSEELIVGEVSAFAQKALDSYHGYVRLRLVERPYQPPPRVAADHQQSVNNNRKSMAALGGRAVATATDKSLVCEVMLTLPKV